MTQANNMVKERKKLTKNSKELKSDFSKNKFGVDTKKVTKIKFSKAFQKKKDLTKKRNEHFLRSIKNLNEDLNDTIKRLDSRKKNTLIVVGALLFAYLKIRSAFEGKTVFEYTCDIFKGAVSNIKFGFENLGNDIATIAGNVTGTNYDTGKISSNTQMSNGKLSSAGEKALIQEEGLKIKAYQDTKGIWTIGVGHTGKVDGVPVGSGMVITEQKAKDIFRQDVQRFENYVNSKVKVPVTQNMFDAMVSYAFNVGYLGPKFLQKLNEKDYKGAAKELDSINEELKGRRAREQKMFLTGVENNKLTGSMEIISQNTTNIGNGGGGVTYSQFGNLTSHTKLTSGYNQYYNPNANTDKNMGTFMGKVITSGVGARSIEKGSKWHKGLDLRYVEGTPVYAFCSGTVYLAGWLGEYGRVVILQDRNGYRHVYGHLSKIRTEIKDKSKKYIKKYIKKGELIGNSGSSGNGKDGYYSPHLHYGIWRPGGTSDAAFIDPRTYNYPNEVEVENYNLATRVDNIPQTKKAINTNNISKNNMATKSNNNINLSQNNKSYVPSKISYNQTYKNTREQEKKNIISSM